MVISLLIITYTVFRRFTLRRIKKIGESLTTTHKGYIVTNKHVQFNYSDYYTVTDTTVT